MPERRLDDGWVHVGRQQRRGEGVAKAMERSIREPGLAHDTPELTAKVVRVDRCAVFHGEDVIGVLPRRPSPETHLKLSILYVLQH